MNENEAYQDLRWHVQLSVRYHDRREGFFRFWHTLAMLLVVLGSTTAAGGGG